jgi:hypothetical protein
MNRSKNDLQEEKELQAERALDEEYEMAIDQVVTENEQLDLLIKEAEENLTQ